LRNEFSILLLAKPLAWLAVVLVATLLLRRQQVTKKVRLAFLIGGVIFFGFLIWANQRRAPGYQPGLLSSQSPLLDFRTTAIRTN